jgi:hypothetical protein
MNDLKALHLIHSTIKYYQIFGATPEIRDELLTVARRAPSPRMIRRKNFVFQSVRAKAVRMINDAR